MGDATRAIGCISQDGRFSLFTNLEDWVDFSIGNNANYRVGKRRIPRSGLFIGADTVLFVSIALLFSVYSWFDVEGLD